MRIPNSYFTAKHPAQPVSRRNERGNAAIYVLIVVALFAALAFTVARQNDSSERAALSDEKADIIANQILSYPYQVKQAIEMMIMSGTQVGALDFTQPGQSGYDSVPLSGKIYHPGGGGLTLARLPQEGVLQNSTSPPAGWYLGMFNNLEWTQTTQPDLMLVAYQLTPQICARINYRLTGKIEKDTDGAYIIPVLGNTIPNVLIDKENPPGVPVHGGSNVTTFDASLCADCEDKPSLCVKDSAGRYGFYSLILNH